MRSVHSALVPFLLLTACATRHEAVGDRAFHAGDIDAAADAYDVAMGDRPIMDFEYERIRKKRLRLMEGEFSPKVDALLATAPTPTTPAYITELLELRREAFASGVPEALAARIDAEVLRVSEPAVLTAAAPDAVPAQLAMLRELYDSTLREGAPQQTLDAITAAYGASLAVGYPAPPAGEGLARLTALLDGREAVRARRFPVAVDAAYDAELAKLADATFAPATPDTGIARFGDTLALRTRARALGAPPAAIALADKAHEDAYTQVLVRAEAESAARRYLPLFDELAPLAARVEPGHPLLARLDTVAREGAAWHAEQAAALPAGYRKLLHLALAATLGGDRKAAEAARKGLESGFVTSLTLQPSVSEAASCTGNGGLIAGSLGKGARAVPLQLSLGRCDAREGDSQSTRYHEYIAEEIYYVQENVQVGTVREKVQVGTHKEQCTQDSSLDGYVWTGVCDVPDYEWRDTPVYELRDVEKRRDVEKSVGYTVTTRTVDVSMSGTAALTWDDGTTLAVPFAQQRTESAEAWSYVVPGRTPQDRSTSHTQSIPTWHTPAAFRSSMGSALGGEIARDVAAKVRAHRAHLARAEGTRALAAGDAAGAGEAFVRSVLHDGKAEGDAIAWLTRETGLTAAVLEGVLASGGASRAVPAGTPLPVAAAYAPEALTVGAGAALRVDEVITAATDESYDKGIMPPNELVNFHVGLVPSEIQTGAAIGSRVAPVAFGIDLYYSPVEILAKLRYGLVLNDQLGLRFSMGMTYVEKEEYTNGDDEGPIALTVDPSYALHLGLRTPYVGLFAGASAGYLHAASGDTVAFGYHIEPSARLTVRAFGTHNIIAEASGFLFTVPGVARKDRLTLSFPVLGRKGMDVKLSAERTMLPARHLAADGETKESLGTLPVQMVGVQVGARL